MDLLYAAAIAERREHLPLTLLDAIGHRWNAADTLERLESEAPTHIGVRVSLPSLDLDVIFANEVKRQNPTAQVFLFGHAAQTTYPQWAANCKVDACSSARSRPC